MLQKLSHTEPSHSSAPSPDSEQVMELPPGWVAEQKQSSVCPKCKRHALSRVPRPFFLKSLLPGLPIRKYKCKYCFKVVYKRKKSVDGV